LARVVIYLFRSHRFVGRVRLEPAIIGSPVGQDPLAVPPENEAKNLNNDRV
jgi:hypothetical protein